MNQLPFADSDRRSGAPLRGRQAGLLGALPLHPEQPHQEPLRPLLARLRPLHPLLVGRWRVCLSSSLCRDPSRRPTLDDLLCHPFITMYRSVDLAKKLKSLLQPRFFRAPRRASASSLLTPLICPAVSSPDRLYDAELRDPELRDPESVIFRRDAPSSSSSSSS